MNAPTPSSPEPAPSAGGRRRTSPLRGWRTDGGRPRGRRVLQVAALAAGALALGGCKLPAFYAERPVTGQEQDAFNLYSGTVIAAIVVGVITGGLILFAALRYRRRSEAVPRQFQYHIPLEIFYTVVPIAIVLVLFGFTVTTENTVDKVPANAPQKVLITAFQWGWKFDYVNQGRYVEGIRTQNPDPVGLHGQTCDATAPNPDWCLGPGLVMPVGETVDITLVSNDVIHSFYVPQFLFSRQALPGVRNRFAFTVDHPGIFRAQCNNICGLYHAQMFFHVVALPPAQFAAWVHGPQTRSDTSAGPVPTGPQSATGGFPSLNAGGPTSSSGTIGNAGVNSNPVTPPQGSVPVNLNTGGQLGGSTGSSSSSSLGGAPQGAASGSTSSGGA